MTKRVVSKRTKALFIAFGATGIASVCIVTAAEMGIEDARVRTASATAIVRPAATAQPAK